MDLQCMAIPVTVMFTLWLGYMIVTKALQSGVAMVLAALMLVGIICTWILLYAVIYKYLGVIDDGVKSKDPRTCLYFSIVTWTTLGYRDVRP